MLVRGVLEFQMALILKEKKWTCLKNSECVLSVIVVLICCVMMTTDRLFSCSFLGPFITWWSNNAERDYIQVSHAVLQSRQNNSERNLLISTHRTFTLLQDKSIQNVT